MYIWSLCHMYIINEASKLSSYRIIIYCLLNIIFARSVLVILGVKNYYRAFTKFVSYTTSFGVMKWMFNLCT